jgi:hypothetical protein
VFVAFPFRRMGFARALIDAVCGKTNAAHPGSPRFFTHHKGRELAKAFADMTYSPFPLYEAVRLAAGRTRRPIP